MKVNKHDVTCSVYVLLLGALGRGPSGAVEVLAPAWGQRRFHCPPDPDGHQVLSSGETRANQNQEANTF